MKSWILVAVVLVSLCWFAIDRGLESRSRGEAAAPATGEATPVTGEAAETGTRLEADDLVTVAGRKRPHGKRTRSSQRGGAIDTFAETHKVLPGVYGPGARTIYCGCRVLGKKIDLASCGYRVHKDRKRAEKLEWEHVVPAHAFGQSFTEWRKGSPLCMRRGKRLKNRDCAKTNPDFNLMESDLYNLWPEVGELNGLRSNFSMAEISGRALTFGGCSAKIADKKFEPMDMAKGTVARVYMYMEWKYPGHGIVSNKNRPLYEAWDKQHPVTEAECEIGRKVFAIQGNANPVLAARCKAFPKDGKGPLVAGLEDTATAEPSETPDMEKMNKGLDELLGPDVK